jgi:hypothetical protein
VTDSADGIPAHPELNDQESQVSDEVAEAPTPAENTALPAPTKPKTPKPVKPGKPEPKEIDVSDMANYLKTESDFGFEIQVVNAFRCLGWDVQHGGTYIDGVTRKPRQFDLRVTGADPKRTVRLAVEVKNLKTTYPVLVSCLPRNPEESFQHVALSLNLDYVTFADSPQRGRQIAMRANEPDVRTLEITGANCIYSIGEPVGKAVSQVGRDSNGKFRSSDDSEVYGKWSQAISSADELVAMSSSDGERSEASICFSIVVPVLVVPDNTLWRCCFDFDGKPTIPPEQCKRVQLFIGKSCQYGGYAYIGEPYTLSHLEIVTLSGIDTLLGDLTKNDLIIPDALAKEVLKQYILFEGFGR